MTSSSGTTVTSPSGSGSRIGSGSGIGTETGCGFGSYLIRSSGSEPDLQHLMDQRKKKRMISNRESARRSRKRKQKHLDDLTSQLSQLRKENNETMSSVSITTQHYMSVEAENDVLRVQVAELSRHLQSLNDIICIMQPHVEEPYGWGGEFVDENNSLSYLCATQPILATAANTFMY